MLVAGQSGSAIGGAKRVVPREDGSRPLGVRAFLFRGGDEVHDPDRYQKGTAADVLAVARGD